ncbi:MAG: hypothetical protein AB7S56_09945 [Halothiobacillaceae bacterium]
MARPRAERPLSDFALHAYLAIALSVALHVGWNLMARHAKRECDPLWWALAAHNVGVARMKRSENPGKLRQCSNLPRVDTRAT